MDFLIKFLAQVFSSFKLKNPAVAAIVLVVLATVQAAANNASFFGVVTLPEWAAEVLRYITTFLLAVTGSQTYQYLQTDKNTAKS